MNQLPKPLVVKPILPSLTIHGSRGQNENDNGLLRQYFPKTVELVNVAMKQVFEAVDKLNSRPRKCLGFKTPYEAFEELTGVNIRNLMGYALIT